MSQIFTNNWMIFTGHHKRTSRSKSSRKHPTTVDMLPIVTRGCLCELPKKMGLTASATNGRFNLSNQVHHCFSKPVLKGRFYLSTM